MNECASFWFWFTRPFAEFLGGVALFVGCVVVLTVGFYVISLVKR